MVQRRRLAGDGATVLQDFTERSEGIFKQWSEEVLCPMASEAQGAGSSKSSTEETLRETLTELAEALLKAQERLEPEGIVTWERADARLGKRGLSTR